MKRSLFSFRSLVRWPLAAGLAVVIPVAAATAATPPADAPARPTEAKGGISGRVQNIATAQYLSNARITIKGTELTTLTDDEGSFRLGAVPAGPIVMQVYYTGLDPQEIPLNVPAGGIAEQNVELTNRARYGTNSGIVKLDPFVAASSRLTEGEALATNEQRFAANIKSVVATDAFGDVTEGNVAEFMRYVPGISVTYSDVMPLAVSVRGFDPSMTTVTMDGGQLANASRNATTRQFDFQQVSINNISRIEVTKVPTPANPASGISGIVNMVSKSAFERSKAQFNYRVFESASSDSMELRSQPFPYDTYEHRVNPGFDFDYTLPVTKNFGLVLTALSSKAWNEQNISQMTWNATAANTGASEAHPFLQTQNLIEAPKWYFRNSAGLHADWRIAPNSVLSLGLQATYFQDTNSNMSRASTVGTNPAPTPATGTALSYGADSAHSATGRGAVTFSDNYLHIDARTLGSNLRYQFENSDWEIDTDGYASDSKTWLRSPEKGSFNALGIALLNTAGVRVNLDNIRPEGPAGISAFDASNKAINLLDIHNFKLNTATSAYRDHRDDTEGADLNVKRKLSLFGEPFALQVGSSFKSQDRDHRRYTAVYTYNPANPADPTPAPFLMQVYTPRPNHFGYDDIPWASPNGAVTAWGKNPNLFTQTPAQIVTEEQTRIVGSEAFKEITSAFYAEGQMHFFQNRLQVLTGVRFEKVHDKAAGPLFDPNAVYVRNPDGTFAHDSAGALIRRPDAGAVGSLQELHLTRIERGNKVNRANQGYYPSLHLTFNATDNLLFRAAYAKSYGQPDFNNLIPNTTINQNDLTVGENADPSVIKGTITVRNPQLKPWHADNYDLSAEYYTNNGGEFSVGVFRKDLTDFFNTNAFIATAQDAVNLGLDPAYAGWQVTTTVNGGNARILGAEFNVRQSLEKLGQWGRLFSVFANATKLKLEGDATADFSSFNPEVFNWGVTFTRRPVTLMLKWNHLGEVNMGPSPAEGADAFLYQDARTTMDVNFTFLVWKQQSFFINGRNIFNKNFDLSRYGPTTPDYARRSSTNEYGVQWTFGIKGTF